MILTIVIPTFNELKNGYLENILRTVTQTIKDEKDEERIEVIIVDSNSTDGTLKLVEKYDTQVILTDTNSRAQRINLGLEAAKGEIILMHHPRSLLQSTFLNELKSLPLEVNWGAFTHSFDLQHHLLDFTSWYSNNIRGDIFKTFYLDHCLFLRKDCIPALLPLPEVDIFEDTILCKRLKNLKATRLKSISTTSAIRFKKAGVYKQAIKNQILKWLYYFNVNHKKMNLFYEKKSKLNADYENK